MPVFPFQWQQILDVLIVAVLFYYLLYFVRGTKTGIVLQGIALVAVVYFVCELLGLFTLVWILKGVMFLGPIALIVIFTPEIRHFLERAGRTRLMFSPFHSKSGVSTTKELIDELLRAVTILSDRRIGGLIAIVKDRSALESMVLGVEIDAEISADLILTIFDPSAPLHDGAVIIDGTRISHAGCFFPLAEREHPIKQLGTRHHAGIGITERSEIVVIVVSEETGAMSICHNGRISYNLTREQMEELLNLLVQPDAERASVLPRMLPE